MSFGTWSYDGSLEGLLMLAAKAAGDREAPGAVANALAPEGELFALLGPSPLEFPAAAPLEFPAASPSEFPAASPLEFPAEAHAAAGNTEGASSYLRALSTELFDLIIRIWMSEEALELALLEVCAEVGRRGPSALGDHGDPRLRSLVQASRRVMHETHRLIGLARFSRRRDGLWSAPIEPDHNVLASLIPHFSRRFGSEAFAIVDTKRRLAALSLEGRVSSASDEQALELLSDPADDEDASLWKRYFKAVDNPSRRNLSLQRRLMPVRYWKYLTELGSS